MSPLEIPPPPSRAHPRHTGSSQASTLQPPAASWGFACGWARKSGPDIRVDAAGGREGGNDSFALLGYDFGVRSSGQTEEVGLGLAYEQREVRNFAPKWASQDRIMTDPGIVLALPGSVLVLLWHHYCATLVLHEYCAGTALILSLFGIAAVLLQSCDARAELVPCCYYAGTRLVLDWRCIGSPLVLRWSCKATTRLLTSDSVGATRALRQFCARTALVHTGDALVLHWRQYSTATVPASWPCSACTVPLTTVQCQDSSTCEPRPPIPQR